MYNVGKLWGTCGNGGEFTGLLCPSCGLTVEFSERSLALYCAELARDNVVYVAMYPTVVCALRPSRQSSARETAPHTTWLMTGFPTEPRPPATTPGTDNRIRTGVPGVKTRDPDR